MINCCFELTGGVMIQSKFTLTLSQNFPEKSGIVVESGLT
jgi:hypothetical protein